MLTLTPSLLHASKGVHRGIPLSGRFCYFLLSPIPAHARRRVTPMTPAHKRLVQDSWEQVAPIAETAAELFYSRLFELDPTLRQLFAATDMKAQGKMLMQMLAVAV